MRPFEVGDLVRWCGPPKRAPHGVAESDVGIVTKVENIMRWSHAPRPAIMVMFSPLSESHWYFEDELEHAYEKTEEDW